MNNFASDEENHGNSCPIVGQLYFTISNNEFKYVNSDIKNYKELLRATLWKSFLMLSKKTIMKIFLLVGEGIDDWTVLK